MFPGLVSVITPCYNTGRYLSTLLESVLGQTYPYIEMFAIDDGSIDNTAEVIKSYIPKFEEKGYSLTYVWQKNSGQSVAIQKGLELMSGEYLVWPDSDDYYASSEAIEKMVERLKEMPDEVAMVRTQELIVEDSPEHKVIRLRGENASELESYTLFEDCLFNRNGYFYIPGAYMVKTEALRKATRLPIYTEKNAGQNWQLMLPVLYRYRCSTILEPLYNVVYRLDSHSRGQYVGYEETVLKFKSYYKTIIATLEHIKNIEDCKLIYYKKEIDKSYNKLFFICSLSNCRKKESEIYYKSLIQLSVPIPFRDRIKYCFLKMGLLPFVLKLRTLIKNVHKAY